MLRPRHAEERRRAVILMVVLALLTLFAIVGITFVFYAQKSNSASVNFRESSQAGTVGGPDIDPSILFRWAVGQLIYDAPDDASGTQSGLRGHSLARTMYSYNDQVLNIQPYNGTGRLHYTQPATAGVFAGADDYQLINYTYFFDPQGVQDKLRDPERIGTRSGPTDPNRGPSTGGANASYTYPDLNSLFLGASLANGTLMMPSFHRPWLFNPTTGLNDTTNGNWYNPQGKYLTLRPRPYDHLTAAEQAQVDAQQTPAGKAAVMQTLLASNPNRFWFPSDAGGDIKNRVGSLGSNNDSIWIDLGYPVTQSADGTKFKPLFAWYVEDLDGRINVNAAGNLMGSASGVSWHSSNRGLGKWEVSLAPVLNRPNYTGEWRNLFLGTPTMSGRYGGDLQPGRAGSSAPQIYPPRFFAQVDLNGADETNGNNPTGPITLSTTFYPFPTFPGGYDNGNPNPPSPTPSALTNHALLYDYFNQSGTDDRMLPATDMRKLMYRGGSGSDAMSAEVAKLCPQNFTPTDPTNLRRQQMVTTLNMEVNRLGLAPWLFDRQSSGYGAPPDAIPFGPATAFPDPLANRSTTAVPASSDFHTPGQQATSVQTDWRSNDAALEKINLDQPLPRYPHQAAGMLNGYHGRYDNPNAVQAPYTLNDVQNQFNQAQQARQNLADAIYRRLLAVTGAPAPDPTRLTAPNDTELAPLRWLAQLAVNIVDYIDEDEISTPFYFYGTAYNYFTNQQLPATAASTNTANPNANNESVPKYWVFGTELPPVVLNEALAEYQTPGANGPFFVQVWTELFSPFPNATPPGAQSQDSQKIPLYQQPVNNMAGTDYSVYKVAIANTETGPGRPYGPLMNVSGNVTGTPSMLRSDGVFTSLNTGTVGAPNNQNTPTAVDPQNQNGGYFLMGADSNTANNSISPNAPNNVPAATPWYQTPSMKYKVTVTNGTWDIDDRPNRLTLLLRRVANPHLPPDPNPTTQDASGNTIVNPKYNPYITLDYMEGVPLKDATTPPVMDASSGKSQPYASDKNQVADQTAGGNTKHTFGQKNTNAATASQWLVHLDRTPVSPMELLYVSGFRPHELTHKFINGAGTAQQHRIPWFDEDLSPPMSGPPPSHRLWRLFSFLEVADRAARISPRGRTPGKLNINTIWEPEVFQALCDASASNAFTATDVQNMWNALVASRTPGLGNNRIGPGNGQADRPFLELAGVGHLPSTDPQAALATAPNTPVINKGRGLEDTIFRLQDPTGAANSPRLFQVVNAQTSAHPYLQYDMLTKVYNNLTTRSNTFGVWLTVGFFQVIDDSTLPVKLGPEIGASTATNIQHKFFCLVDRTQIVLAPRLTTSTTAVTPGQAQITVTQKTGPNDPFNGLNGFITYSGSNSGQISWQIQPGSILVVDRGTPQEETVVVTGVDTTNNRFQATFLRPHGQKFGITMPGNPGPQPLFDPSSPNYLPVVPYWETLQ